MNYLNSLTEKFKESLKAVLPIVGIVLLLAFTVAPIPSSILLTLNVGSVLLIVGQMFFSLGAEIAMEPMGSHMGTRLTKTKNLPIILIIGFILGFIITISEPDLQVLAGQVRSIPNQVLIYSVAFGVGLFLVLSLARTFLGVSLKLVLILCYVAVFALSFFAPSNFLAVAFDSGGVTTGPMTVPFIMSFGVGISALRTDKKAADDSFGTIALCSVGPILAVLILSIIYMPQDADYASVVIPNIAHSVELGNLFAVALPSYLKEIALALLPIVAFFAVYQIVALRLSRGTLSQIIVGIIFTYVGLVLFLTGVNVGFMPAGSYLGETLAKLDYNWIIIPIGMIIGYFIVKAEPAVGVLERQVEDLTHGAVSGKVLQRTLSIGVAASVGLAMLRVLTGIPIIWFVGGGYLIAIVMAIFTPDMFTAIAFDSGGVASGPMTATFLLPFAEGACIALGGNVVTDAFGVVAMVAMTPLIAIQALGLVYKYVTGGGKSEKTSVVDVANYVIIEL